MAARATTTNCRRMGSAAAAIRLGPGGHGLKGEEGTDEGTEPRVG
jgi:hypothetical protein